MTTNCKKCGWQVEKVDLSEETALEIWGLVIQETKLYFCHDLLHQGARMLFYQFFVCHLVCQSCYKDN